MAALITSDSYFIRSESDSEARPLAANLSPGLGTPRTTVNRCLLKLQVIDQDGLFATAAGLVMTLLMMII